MAKKEFDINSFLKKSPEEQAKAIERETQRLLNRLPSLKDKLSMYNEVSDEMYNLSPEEVEFQGIRQAQAVRTGEITTPTGKQAYNNFVKNLHRYARRNIHDLAVESAEMRMKSWLDNIKTHASQDEIDYAEELVNSMSENEKIGFTRSKYFLDVGDWNSDNFKQYIEEYDYSIMTQKLELYLKRKGHKTGDTYKYQKIKKG